MNSDVINERYYGDSADPMTERTRERIHWICGQATGRQVLDLGCSQGIVCLILGREGFDCTGIDLESPSIVVAREALAKEDEIVRQRVRFQVGDAGQLRFPDESFDTVVLGEILEHLTHPTKVLTEAKRVLRNGGRLVITVPHGLNAYPDHKHSFYPISLLELLRPLFQTSGIGTLGNYITYTGVKDSGYRPEVLSKEVLLEECRRLENELEERCLSKERSLLETATKLYGQIKHLNGQIAEQTAKIAELEETVASKERQVQEISISLGQVRSLEESLRQAAAHVEAELTAKAAKMQELQDVVLAQDRKLGQLETNLGQARDLEASLRQAVARAETEAAVQGARIPELQTALAAREVKIQDLESHLEQARAAFDSLREVNVRAQMQSETQSARNKELLEMVSVKEAQVRELEASLEQVRASTAEVRIAAARAEVEASLRESRLKELEEALVVGDRQVQDLQTKLEHAGSAAGALREQLTGSEAAKAAQITKIRSLEETVAADASRTRELEARSQRARDLEAELRAKLAETEAALARLQAETRTTVEATLAATEQRLKEMQAESAQLRKDLASKDVVFQQRLAQMETLHAGRLREREKQHEELQAKGQSDWKRRLTNQRLRDLARLVLPRDAHVLVISKGDDDLLGLDGRIGLHFPQTLGGVYAGHHPADSAEAIKHLETLKTKGADFLLIPSSSLWWLDFYKDFHRHLETNYRLVVYNEDCLIFALTPAPRASRNFRLALEAPSVAGAQTAGEPGPASQPKASPAITLNPLNGSKPAPTPPPGEVVPKVEVNLSRNGAPNVVAEPPEVSRVPAADPRPSRNSSVFPVAGPVSQNGSKTLTLGCILDEFTAACFRPEGNLVTFRPDNWKSVLEGSAIDALFVESAWQGNSGSWQYKIASYQRPMGEELVEVIDYCKSRKIPTIFWNKEDPSHFDRFLHRAHLFDYVFTSDADMIPKYREVVKHDRVFALPFAAQPELHNPIVEMDRLHNVCFAGAYYALDHSERRADMDHLLLPALSYGLHIYDRQQGVVGTNAKAFQFPEIYQPAIKGRLEYDQMVKAYKWYKVFLNVNSVKQSPTMFSRRVFELLASGTPVVSSYSKGISALLGEGVVHIAQSEEETRKHLERLLKDDSYWAKIMVRGVRAVLSQHTYAHRLAEICRRVGLPLNRNPQPKISAFVSVEAAGDLKPLAKTLAAQTYRNFSLTVIRGKALAKARVEALKNELPDVEIQILPHGVQFPEPLVQAPEGSYVWLINRADHYGDNFLMDAALATVYSEAEVIGKHTHLELGVASPGVKLTQPGQEFRFVKNVSGGSIIAQAGKLESKEWKAIAANRNVELAHLQVLSIDRFNYVKGGGRIGGVERAGSRSVLETVAV